MRSRFSQVRLSFRVTEERRSKEEEKGDHGILVERCATRENSTAEIRQREHGEAVQFHGAARATGSALSTDPGRG